MREIIVYIIFCSIIAAGAFGWGMVYESRRTDYLYKEAVKNREARRDLLGDDSVKKAIEKNAGRKAN